MKRQLNIVAAIVAALSVMTFGCATDPAESVGLTSSTNSFNVTGDGFFNASFKGFTADTASSAKEVSSTGVVYFSGLTSKIDQPFVLVVVTNVALVGSYPIPQGANRISLAINDGNTRRMYEADSGMIEITKWDVVGGKAHGTFSGSLKRTDGLAVLTVTDGKFDIAREP